MATTAQELTIGQRSASHEAARRRFSLPEVATAYPAVFRPRGRDRRELRAILRALANVPAGVHVLDLPCGSGRLLRPLLERGFRVTAVDISGPMLAEAARNPALDNRSAPVCFVAADVLDLPFDDGQFDAVICNRLFHHFTDPRTRQAALRELARVSRGDVVVSFFNSFAFDSLRRRARHWLAGRRAVDRVAMSPAQLRLEAAAVGLVLARTCAVRWCISPQCYAVLRSRRTRLSRG